MELAPERAHGLDARILSKIVSTVASSLDLRQVLRAIVRLLDDEAPVDACLVYLLEDDRLVLRAASPRFAHLVGTVSLARGEGFVWWAAERGEPAAISDHALQDPRITIVPEIDEEPFRSLVAVPVVAARGEVVGAISMHSAQAREPDEDEVELLASIATMVARALENARLYEQARRRVDELEAIAALARAVARAETLDELVREVETRALPLLRADGVRLALGPEARAEEPAELALPLVARDELLGLLVVSGTREVELARAVANQAAVAVEKLRLIDRLTEENVIRTLFDDLAAGRLGPELARRAERLGLRLDARWLVVEASPADDSLERELARLAPGTLVDRRDGGLRALVRVPAPGAEALVGELRHLRRAAGAAVGISSAARGAAAVSAAFAEARDALRAVDVLAPRPPVLAYDELGAYRYLLRLPVDGRVRDAQRDGLRRVAAYDLERRTTLLRTLEEYLARHGGVVSTAEALHVHPNTLRQRLRRVEELSGLSLGGEDWLALEIALKLVRLEEAAARV